MLNKQVLILSGTLWLNNMVLKVQKKSGEKDYERSYD